MRPDLQAFPVLVGIVLLASDRMNKVDLHMNVRMVGVDVLNDDRLIAFFEVELHRPQSVVD